MRSRALAAKALPALCGAVAVSAAGFLGAHALFAAEAAAVGTDGLLVPSLAAGLAAFVHLLRGGDAAEKAGERHPRHDAPVVPLPREAADERRAA